MNVSKAVCALLGVLVGYVFIFHLWFPSLQWLGWERVPRWGFSTWIFIAGTGLMLFAVVPPNKVGKPLLFGIPLKTEWGPGPCILPNFFHFTTEHLNFSLLVGLEYQPEEYKAVEYHDVQVFVDQRLPVHHRNVQVSWFGSKLELVATSLVVWFFNFKKGRPEYVFQRFGFRLVIVAYASAMIVNVSNWTQGIVPQ